MGILNPFLSRASLHLLGQRPSMILFIILPYLLRRDWSFEAAMSISILATVFVYVIGAYLAVKHGNVTA